MQKSVWYISMWAFKLSYVLLQLWLLSQNAYCDKESTHDDVRLWVIGRIMLIFPLKKNPSHNNTFIYYSSFKNNICCSVFKNITVIYGHQYLPSCLLFTVYCYENCHAYINILLFWCRPADEDLKNIHSFFYMSSEKHLPKYCFT